MIMGLTARFGHGNRSDTYFIDWIYCDLLKSQKAIDC